MRKIEKKPGKERAGLMVSRIIGVDLGELLDEGAPRVVVRADGTKQFSCTAYEFTRMCRFRVKSRREGEEK